MKNSPIKPPPPNSFQWPIIVHKITELYKQFYQLGPKIPKRDKFGLYLNLEKLFIELLQDSIKASLAHKENKPPILENLRLNIETSKQLIRLTYELDIFTDKIYIYLQEDLQEISKMTNAWIKYTKEASRLL